MPIPSKYATIEECVREYDKLVDFFRSPEGDAMGRAGDEMHLSPADCAIHFLTVKKGPQKVELQIVDASPGTLIKGVPVYKAGRRVGQLVAEVCDE